MINESLLSFKENRNSILKTNQKILYHSIAIGTSNGTFGELLQGILPDKNHFLVTLPISCYSKAIIIPDDCLTKLEIYPAHKMKSLKLAELILQHFNIQLRGKLIIKSELEEGKGLASSSADLVATARALENILNIKIKNDLLLYLLRQIEPSDGVMYSGFVSFYHRKVELIEYLGHLSPMIIVAIDEGGEIDTIEYNKRKLEFTDSEKKEYKLLLKEISTAIKMSDLQTIGKISTRSAILNQRRNPKHNLNKIIQVCEQVGGLGVIVAHSGTYIGILLDQNDSKLYKKTEEIIYHFSRITCNFRIYESANFGI